MFDIIPVPIVCRTGVLGLRGIGFGLGIKVSGAVQGMWARFCGFFEFSEKLVVSQGDSTRSVNSDMVLVVEECFVDLTCFVPLAGCWLYYHYLPLVKGT